MAISSARLDELKKKFDENPRRYFAPLANEYRKLGDLTQAIALCRAHLPNQPGHISGHIVLAQALYEARELGESRGIFEAALDLDPENLIALRYLGDIAREQGEPLQARGWYERVLDADPRNDEIAALLKALDEERERASVAVEPEAAPFASGFDEAAPADDVAGDDFAPTAIEARFPFVHATSGEQVAQSDDPFFGEAEAAPTIAAGDLEAVAEPSVDDWFAAPPPAAAPQGAAAPEVYGASADEASASEIEASLGFESIDLAAHETAPADGLEESFFPDLASMTPQASPLVPGVATPIDVHAVTPPFLVAQPENASTIPTPAFLQSIAEEPQAEPAPAADAIEADTFSADAFTADAITADAITADAITADAVEVEGVAGSAPQAANGELPDAWELSAADFDVVTPAASTFAPAAATPVASEWELPPESTPAPVAELATSPDDSATFAPFESFVIDEAPAVESAAHALEPTLLAEDGVESIEVVEAVDAGDAIDAVDAVDAVEVVEAFDVFEGAHSSVDESAAPAASAMEGFEAGEFIAGQADDFASEPSDDLDVEYGEFIAPAADEVPYIASSVSVPLDEPDAYTIGAPELSAHEPFPIEEQYRDDDFSTGPVVTASPTPSWNEASPFAANATPVEGFEPHEVAPDVAEAAEEFAVEASAAGEGEGIDARSAAPHGELASPAATGTPFVTETMAELYLQQGFNDEALAIYRQLLETHPDDESLAQRVAALERGAHSAVVEGIAPRDHADRVGQSVRGFFSHFARRQPRHRRSPARRVEGESESGPFAGVATREEALTVPDEHDAAPAPVATLTQLFQGGQVSTADDRAASALAGAFGGEGGDEPGSARDGQLSLEHLFRDVPARSSGAVTLDEFYEGSTPQDARDASGGANGEPDADIEQFTAWLEGLKKK